MGWTTKKSWFDSLQRQQTFFYSKVSRLALGPLFLGVKWSVSGVKLTAHLHPVPRLKISNSNSQQAFLECIATH
jgi:hypothetical protein